jgi:cell division protein FtsW (lipid II flippase)
MIAFIERHNRLSKFYQRTLQLLGWILLCMGGIGLVMLIAESFQAGGRINLEGDFGMLKRSWDMCIGLGLISLGFAQFIRYLCDHKIGLLLRYGDKILYLYAVLAIGREISYDWFVGAAGKMGGGSSAQREWLLFILPITFLYNAARALILVGLGLFLKQLITAIEASKLKVPDT